jgi:hypothetical protein
VWLFLQCADACALVTSTHPQVSMLNVLIYNFSSMSDIPGALPFQLR